MLEEIFLDLMPVKKQGNVLSAHLMLVLIGFHTKSHEKKQI